MNISDPTNKPAQNEQITARARELWQKAGSPEGRDLEFWVGAEGELARDREDVKQTQSGDIQTPARSTPGGKEKRKDETFPKDEDAVKPAKKTLRVAASAK